MKLFLDDLRAPPDATWTVARSFADAVELLSNQDCERISLDHDLGPDQKTGYDLAKWMTANDKWPMVVGFHTANPVGLQNMLGEFAFYCKHKNKDKKPYDSELEREIV